MKVIFERLAHLGMRFGSLGFYCCGIAATSLVLAPAGFASGPPVLQIVSGDHQQAPYMSAFPAPLVVGVMDPLSHHVLSGIRVRFEASPEIGLNTQLVNTDSRGLATVTATGTILGRYKVKAEILGDPESTVTFDSLTVEKAKLAIIPADIRTNVGMVPNITSYSIRGFVNGETLESAHVSGTPVITTTARVTSPEANYAIKGGVGSMSAPNYEFVPGFGVLVISGGSRSAAVPVQDDPDSKYLVVGEENERVVQQTAVNSKAATVPASLILAGTGGEGVETHVQEVEELTRAADTVSAPFASADEVKVVGTLNQPRLVNAIAVTGSVRQANVVMPAASATEVGGNRFGAGAVVRSASALKVEMTPVAAPTPVNPASVQKAFPPSSR